MHKALRENAPLPYPHLVTLFLHHFNIPLDNEPFLKVKRSFAIGATAFPSFEYQKDMDGQWIHKQDIPPNASNERTPSPPPQRDPSSSLLNDVLSELQDLGAFASDRFDIMDSSITQLEDDMNFIRKCFDPPANP